MSYADALEAARCAQINFDNLTRFNPALIGHPFYTIAYEQLKSAIVFLEQGEADALNDIKKMSEGL